MVFGYPGRTQEYAPSYHISMLKDVVYPKTVEIRGRKISIMEQAMANDPLIRLKYSGKSFGIANGWKRSIGEIQSLDKMNGVARKQAFEKEFMEWVSADPERLRRYGKILEEYAEIYGSYTTNYFVNSYTNEVFGSTGVEPASFAGAFRRAVEMASGKEPGLDNELKRVQEYADGFFRNYDRNVSEKLFVAVMDLYGKNIDSEWQTDVYKTLAESCRGDFGLVAGKLFDESIFTDENRVRALIGNFDPKEVQEDIFYRLSVSSSDLIASRLTGELSAANARLAELNKLYMAAQMEQGVDKVFYPDANSTLRLAYGKVMGYESRDAVYHEHQTTLKGVMEKDNPEIYDYDVPDRLKELYEKKDFGRYGFNGNMPVCFIANNHTTGGNSGSPVLNAEGHLIGVNFDRAWEGVASDMMYNPEQSRNISIDIRYALFLIEKFGNAGYLIDEMTIVGVPQQTP